MIFVNICRYENNPVEITSSNNTNKLILCNFSIKFMLSHSGIYKSNCVLKSLTKYGRYELLC